MVWRNIHELTPLVWHHGNRSFDVTYKPTSIAAKLNTGRKYIQVLSQPWKPGNHGTECDSITNQGHIIQADDVIGSISPTTQQYRLDNAYRLVYLMYSEHSILRLSWRCLFRISCRSPVRSDPRHCYILKRVTVYPMKTPELIANKKQRPRRAAKFCFLPHISI